MDRATILETHRGWLTSVLRARVGAAATADDLWQEVAIAYLRGGPPDADRAAPWLYRTALRQVLMHRRTVGRRLRREDVYARERSEHAPSADPLEWLIRAERRASVEQAVARLPPGDAEILMLRYGHDLSSRELAGRLGIQPAAVDQRLSRARRRLRDELTSTLGPRAEEASAGRPSAATP